MPTAPLARTRATVLAHSTGDVVVKSPELKHCKPLLLVLPVTVRNLSDQSLVEHSQIWGATLLNTELIRK